jgi:hypothetical protein
MQRRRFLAALAASLPVAGCLSRGSPGGTPGTDTDTPADPTAASPGDAGGTDTPTPGSTETDTRSETPTPRSTVAPDETAFDIGEPAGDFNPHGLSLLNEGEETRTVDLRIADAGAGETLLEESYTLASGERVDGTIEPLGAYEVRVAIPETGAEHVTTVDYFDVCNSYGTDVTIDADGSISSRMWQTLAACPPGGTPPSEPFTVGETTGDVNPHGLTIRNDAGRAFSARLRITDAETDETLFEETYLLEAGASADGDLRGPATYEVRVEISRADAVHTTTVGYFDTCNDYGTTVTIGTGATFSTETVKTDAYCGDG